MPSPHTELPIIRLKLEVQGRHPRFFRKQIQKPEHPLPPGSLVRVIDRTGRPIGFGFYNSRATSALRLISRGKKLAADWLEQRLATAIDLREKLLRLPRDTDGYRLVHAEGDGLPGLVIDKLGPALVAQLSSRGLEQRIEEIGSFLLQRYPGAQLLLSIDPSDRAREGLSHPGSGPGQPIELSEHGLRYQVVPGGAHKTGFFCDQRDNRLAIRAYAKGRRVLDLCCNAGGFAMQAARAGAKSILAVDLDEEAVARTRSNARRNKLKLDVRQADAFDILRGLKKGEHDLLILDPPKWVQQKSEIERGLARYRDLNREAFKKCEEGAIVVSCSCSGLVDEGGFIRTVREAAAQARRDVQILSLRGAGPDHPIALEVPESRYLKVLTMRVGASG